MLRASWNSLATVEWLHLLRQLLLKRGSRIEVNFISREAAACKLQVAVSCLTNKIIAIGNESAIYWSFSDAGTLAAMSRKDEVCNYLRLQDLQVQTSRLYIYL